MKDIKAKLDNLQRALKTIEQEEYKAVFTNVYEILENLTNKVEESMVNQAVLAETVNYLNDDLSGIQEELFEEVSLEDLDEIEEEYTETVCQNCKKPIFIETSALKEGTNIPCPYCGEGIKE